MSEYLSGILAAAAGMVAAAAALSVVRDGRAPRPAGGARADDLEEARQFLLARVGELDADRPRLDPEEYRALRAELERELADVLREADRVRGGDDATVAGAGVPGTQSASGIRGQSGAAPAGPDRSTSDTVPAPPRTPGWLESRPVLRGAIWGGGAVAFAVVLMWLLVQGLAPRGDSMTGGPAGAPGPAAVMAGRGTGDGGTGPAGVGRPTGPSDAGREALDRLRAEVAANPDDPGARLELAHALLGAQQFDEAREHNDAVLEGAPRDPEALTHQALLRSAAGDTASGITTLEGVLKEQPDFLEALFFRGMLAMRHGDREGMRRAWGRYVEVAPEGDSKAARLKGMLDGGAGTGRGTGAGTDTGTK